jgi:hypothetical protein
MESQSEVRKIDLHLIEKREKYYNYVLWYRRDRGPERGVFLSVT